MKIKVDGQEPQEVEGFRLQVGRDEYDFIDRGEGMIYIYYSSILTGKALAVLPESGNVVKLTAIRK